MAEIRMTAGSLYIYTHWLGSELPELAKHAIFTAAHVWDDEDCATHALVDQITRYGRDETTGWGLLLDPSSAEDSYNHDQPSVIIDLVNQVLTVKGVGAGEWHFSECGHSSGG